LKVSSSRHSRQLYFKPWGNSLQDAGFGRRCRFFYAAEIGGTVAKVKMNAILLNIQSIFWQPTINTI
jgi:hypothetical protein